MPPQGSFHLNGVFFYHVTLIMNCDLFLEMFTVEGSHFLFSYVVYWQLLFVLLDSLWWCLCFPQKKVLLSVPENGDVKSTALYQNTDYKGIHNKYKDSGVPLKWEQTNLMCVNCTNLFFLTEKWHQWWSVHNLYRGDRY
jgi:hypothetical protein